MFFNYQPVNYGHAHDSNHVRTGDDKIGVDALIEFNDHIFRKPKNREENKQPIIHFFVLIEQFPFFELPHQ